MVGLSQMYINNNYMMIDATGQGTSWARGNRDFLGGDYTLEDAPLQALEILLIFKLTYYFTGDLQWKY